MPGPSFKSLQSAAAAAPPFFFFFFVALPNSIFAFGFQFAIAIGHAKSVNYTTLAAPLAGVWRSKLRQIVIVVPPSSGLALSYALRQPPPPMQLVFCGFYSSRQQHQRSERTGGRTSSGRTTPSRCPTHCRD